MTITQTIDVPPDRRVTLPKEVPVGRVIFTFTPAPAAPAHPCPICARNIDTETGNPRYGPETVAAIEEGRAMLRGEIPTKWYDSLDEMIADLESDDEDDD